MVSNIRIFRKFRNYFIDLKNSGIANRFELIILEPYFPIITKPATYFNDTDSTRDPINLLHLMSQLNDKLNSPDRGKIIELYVDIFGDE